MAIEFGLLWQQYFCNLRSIGFLLMPYSCIVMPYVDIKHKFFQTANRKRLKFNIMHAVSNALFYCISWPLKQTSEFGLVSEQCFCNVQSIGFLLMPYSCIVRPYEDIKLKFFTRLIEKRLKFYIMHAVSNPLFYCISWQLNLGCFGNSIFAIYGQ
jgi:glucose-6-phosphate-specific signal transduction histidine kinase